MRTLLHQSSSSFTMTRASFAPGLRSWQSLSNTSTRRHLSSSILRPSFSHPSAKTLRASTSSPHTREHNNPPTTTPPSFFTPSLCRHASTSTSSAARSESAPISTAEAAKASLLDWNTFFKLRTSRRRYSLISSLVSSLATTSGSIIAISAYPEVADAITKIIPLDPFASMGIATFASTLLGWLLGPFFGNALWRALHRSRLSEFTAKERAFFERIKKHRVDPTGASTNNPVPDYYGEKIGSVQGYRGWLKDQRAFNRKRGSSFVS